MIKPFPFVLLFCWGIIVACNNDSSNDSENNSDATPSLPMINYSVVASYPHDTSLFTQGLAFWNDHLFESAGNYGESRLVETDLKSGKILRSIALDKKYFAEGITVLGNTIYQLTWKEKVVFAYSASDFKKVAEFRINTEGWGITHNGTDLIVSDGSNNLYYYAPADFRLLKVTGITQSGSPAMNLNELEYINGFIYANQWQYNYIVKIDPASGQVAARIDLSDVAARIKARLPQADFLNGIAHNPVSDKIYVTGKNWPELYEIQFTH